MSHRYFPSPPCIVFVYDELENKYEKEKKMFFFKKTITKKSKNNKGSSQGWKKK